MTTRAPVLVHITTVPETLGFLTEQVRGMARRGYEVHVVSSPGERLDGFATETNVIAHGVPMRRQITPVRDLVALARLWRLLRRLRPEIVHAHTPKAGLLGMIAASAAGVPVRVYNVLGLPLVTARGPRRFLLAWSERTSCLLAHRVLAISPSIEGLVTGLGLCPSGKVKVLGQGGSFGIDPDRHFNPARYGQAERSTLRARLQIPETATVLGFVGRLAREKGIVELMEAWNVLREENAGLRLLVVGSVEPHDPPSGPAWEAAGGDERIHWIGRVDDPAPYYSIMDVLTLPSYREGFGTVNLEAAAMGLPVVATLVPGCVDSVRAGFTGQLVSPRDSEALADGLRGYLDNPALRAEHGRNGRERVIQEFRSERLEALTDREYQTLLRSSRPTPQRSLGRFLKRAGDVIAAALGLILLAPVIAVVALAVARALGRPVLFRQPRAGRDGRVFTLYKFRTMRDAVAADGTPLPDVERLTPFGRWLRRTSLDELPQLWNVLRGEMSLVGPRPLLVDYLPLYSAEQSRRHEVRPGLTGWSQIRGRNTLGWDDRLAADVWYVDHWSLRLDVRILLLTVVKVVAGDGVSGVGTATMTRFQGSGVAD